MLGASGWQTFWRVTLPNIKWGLLYGVILCNARAMGEFGAVSVVSGHIRGETNTLPLHVEILYNEYNFAAAFAVASLLALLALVTLARQVRWSSGARARRRARAALAGSKPMSIELSRASASASAASPRCDDVDLRRRDRRARRAARPVGLGQDDAAADHRRAGSAPTRGTVRFHGEDATDRARARAQRRLRVPALRAVPPHDRLRERRLRPARAAARAAAAEAEIRDAVHDAARAGAARLARRPLSAPALRRPAAARRARARAGRRAARAAARRAVRRARRQGAPGAAPLAAAAARRRCTSPASSSRTTRRRRSRSPTASS